MDQSWDGKGEVKRSILLHVGHFLLIYVSKKMLVNMIIFILFTGISEFLNILKNKKYLPHAGFEPGSLLKLSGAW